jgi:hypothetical protein
MDCSKIAVLEQEFIKWGEKIERCLKERGIFLKIHGESSETLRGGWEKLQQCGISYSCSSQYNIKHENIVLCFFDLAS